MFSERIREALEREVVGQSGAVDSVARGVTRLVSGLTPAERSWEACLLIGPHGTGRSHLVRSLARIFYRDERVFTIHARAVGQVDPWMDLLHRLEPVLASPSRPENPAHPATGGRARPMRLVLVEELERAHKELFPQLAYLLQRGQEILPHGRCLDLDGCMFFFTSGLCTDRILDQGRIGFAEPGGDDEGALYRICREEAEKTFGHELLEQFDDVLVFHPLDTTRLAEVLDRYFARLTHWLGTLGIRCEMGSTAREHLLAVAAGDSGGARGIVRVHRDQVEFPIADLLASGALGPGASVVIDHRSGENHLHLSVQDAPAGARTPLPSAREIPVAAG